MLKILSRRWPEILATLFLTAFSAACISLPLIAPSFRTPAHAALFNAGLSIGTGGIVSFAFYYLVNERLERRRRFLLHRSVRDTYLGAKQNVALAVLHASQKGGRSDLEADFHTIASMLIPREFRALFSGGREGHEGYYAFQNQMNSRTPEYDEIVFNLKIISRAADRIIDNVTIDDKETYDLFVRLNTLIARIEQNGPGYDESKLLCRFIWEIFAGWDLVEGNIDYDRIERAIDSL